MWLTLPLGAVKWKRQQAAKVRRTSLYVLCLESLEALDMLGSSFGQEQMGQAGVTCVPTPRRQLCHLA